MDWQWQYFLHVSNSISKLHWVPRAENEQTRIIDTDDWQISDAFFQYANFKWEPAATHRFAKLPRFNSRF